MKTIFWDFDGVILDSMKVRDFGFEMIFKSFDQMHVNQLLEYHRYNGGLSRYVKIKYFFNEILFREISDDDVLKYATNFSNIMRKELVNIDNLISETVFYIKENYKKYNFHIVSGSDEEELRFLCKELNLQDYFITINGSPTPKNILVNNILLNYKYNVENCCLIGDSINDLEAAIKNDLSFFGYNNESLLDLNVSYIKSFNCFTF